jgi:hypothetical protein
MLIAVAEGSVGVAEQIAKIDKTVEVPRPMRAGGPHPSGRVRIAFAAVLARLLS